MSGLMFADMIKQLRFAAHLKGQNRIASTFRNLFCLLCKFTLTETERVVDAALARWPDSYQLAERSSFLTSFFTPGPLEG